MPDDKILLKSDNAVIRLTKLEDGKFQIASQSMKDDGRDVVLPGQRLVVRLVDGMVVIVRVDDTKAPPDTLRLLRRAHQLAHVASIYVDKAGIDGKMVDTNDLAEEFAKAIAELGGTVV